MSSPYSKGGLRGIFCINLSSIKSPLPLFANEGHFRLMTNKTNFLLKVELRGISDGDYAIFIKDLYSVTGTGGYSFPRFVIHLFYVFIYSICLTAIHAA
jgi:hypothetical protein